MSTPFGPNKRKLAIKDPEPPAPQEKAVPEEFVNGANLCNQCNIRPRYTGGLCMPCALTAYNRDITAIQQNYATVRPPQDGIHLVEVTPFELRRLNLVALAGETFGHNRLANMPTYQILRLHAVSDLGRAVLARRHDYPVAPHPDSEMVTISWNVLRDLDLMNMAHREDPDQCRVPTQETGFHTLRDGPLHQEVERRMQESVRRRDLARRNLSSFNQLGMGAPAQPRPNNFTDELARRMLAEGQPQPHPQPQAPAQDIIRNAGDITWITTIDPVTQTSKVERWYKRCQTCKARGTHHYFCTNATIKLIPVCRDCKTRLVSGDPRTSNTCDHCVPF